MNDRIDANEESPNPFAVLQDARIRLLVGSFILSLMIALREWCHFFLPTLCTNYNNLVYGFIKNRKSASRGSAVLLTGPSDGGKTAIHSAVCCLVFQKRHLRIISFSSYSIKYFHLIPLCKPMCL